MSAMDVLGQTLPWIYAFVGYWPLMMMLVWVTAADRLAISCAS